VLWLRLRRAGAMFQKFAEEVDSLITVIPAEAGIVRP
jgi:hypothetical protein